MINSYNTCQCFQMRQCTLLLEKQPMPDHQWQIVASDLFDCSRGQYMAMADMYSKMCFVQKMHSAGATSAVIISKMKKIFTENGILDILRSDNGPKWGFEHTISSPHYPTLNRFAESIMKIINTAFTKAKYCGRDP